MRTVQPTSRHIRANVSAGEASYEVWPRVHRVLVSQDFNLVGLDTANTQRAEISAVPPMETKLPLGGCRHDIGPPSPAPAYGHDRGHLARGTVRDLGPLARNLGSSTTAAAGEQAYLVSGESALGCVYPALYPGGTLGYPALYHNRSKHAVKLFLTCSVCG